MTQVRFTTSQSDIARLSMFAGDQIDTLKCWLLYKAGADDAALCAAAARVMAQCDIFCARVGSDALLYDDAFAPPGPDKARAFASRSALQKWLCAAPCPERPALIEPIRLSSGEAGFALYAHHLLADGWAFQLLLQALDKALRGEAVSLDAPFADYASREAGYIGSDQHSADAEFFRALAQGRSPEAYLSEADGESLAAVRKACHLTKGQQRAAQTLSRSMNVSPAVVLTAAMAASFARAEQKERFYIGTLLASRARAYDRRVVGCLFHTSALYFDIGAETDFTALCEQITSQTMRLMRHDRLPFGEIQAALRPGAGLFDVLVSYLDAFSLPVGAAAEWLAPKVQTETLQISLIGDRQVFYDYRPSKIDEEAVAFFHKRAMRALVAAAAAPGTPIARLNLLSRGEETKMREWNDTAYPYPSSETLIRLFARQAAARPDQIAVISTERTYTFAEIDRRTNALARALAARQVKPGMIVGVMLWRSPEMLLSILAILKAGAAYMPIMPDYPQERVQFMAQDSACPFIIASGAEDMPGIPLLSWREWTNEARDFSAIDESKPLSPAYVIYTSGSTGKPKGVLIPHHAIINRVQWMNRTFPLAKDDIILQKTPYTFDVSVWELFWWAMYGGTVCLLAPRAEKDPARIIERIETENVTRLHFVPSMLSAFLAYVEATGEAGRLKSLRTTFASGEALLPGVVDRFYRLLPGCELVNLYGPTECTVDVSCFRCPREHLDVIPIGHPIDNTQFYILDSRRQRRLPGEAGELYIGGALVGIGYLNRPELTKDRFASTPLGRLYQTGDLARFMRDGQVEYLGRIDSQVKLRGLRIELGEIENALSRHPAVEKAAVLCLHPASGDYLHAFYQSGEALPADELKALIAKSLPEYMTPTAFSHCRTFPMTSSGKIDRRALAQGVQAPQKDAVKAAAPGADPLVNALCRAFERVLGRPNVSPDDNFFQLGGDSLKAIQLITHLYDTHPMPLQAVFTCRTPIQMANHLSEKAEAAQTNTLRDESARRFALAKPRAGQKEGGALLITGATGFLGVHLLGALLEQTEKTIYCLVRSADKLSAQMAEYLSLSTREAERVIPVRGDLRRETLFENDLEREQIGRAVCAVYHCAADVRHFGAWEDAFQINTLGARRVADFCLRFGASMHHVSTLSVNGLFLTPHDPKVTSFDETQLYIGQEYEKNIYVHSKYLAELAIREATEKGLHASIYRVGNLLWRRSDGKFQQNKNAHDFYAITRTIGEIQRIPAGLHDVRVDFTPVDDCARAIALLSARLPGEVYHLNNPNTLTFPDYFKRVFGRAVDETDNGAFERALDSAGGDPYIQFGRLYFQANKDTMRQLSMRQCCEKTVRALAGCGFRWQEPTDEYLRCALL